MRTTPRSLFSLVTCAALAGVTSTAAAQTPPAPSPAGAPPAGASPSTPAATPPATTPPAPGTPPASTPPRAAPGADAGGSAGWSFALGGGAATGGAGASGGAAVTAPTGAPGAVVSPSVEAAVRGEGLHEMLTLSGSTGLLRVANATSAPVGTFRVQALYEYFSSSGFLCKDSTPCNSNPALGALAARSTSDSAKHLGATFGASATVLPFLEGYASVRSYANSNDASSPELLQVLGDTTLGIKAFLPTDPGTFKFFNAGLDAQLLLLNGSGGVGLNGDSTSFRLRAASTLDFRRNDGEGLPLLVHGNVGYKFDNAHHIVDEVETARNRPISRVERYGLGISRTDALELGLAVEAPLVLDSALHYLRPFVEYTVDVPVNRQGYVCDPAKSSLGDLCLGNESTFQAVPSRLTVGTRANLFLKGLMATAAVDIGVTGTKTFLEETVPQAPWTLWLGIGYAADVVEQPRALPVEHVVAAPATFGLAGFVHEANKPEGIAGAVVRFTGVDQTGFVTDSTGHFRSGPLDPGTYNFTVKAEGHKEGACSATITPGGGPTPAGAPPAGAVPGASTTTYTEVDCVLEAQPRLGGVLGTVTGGEGGAPVAGATVTATDAQGKERTATTDAGGAFKFEGMPPGTVTLRVSQDNYLPATASADVKPREDVRVSISVNKRPKTPQVVVARNEIIIRQQVHFEFDSARILPDSGILLEEIADVLNRTPRIKVVEVQGHTDSSGAAARNKVLSQERADAVRNRLIANGVASSRLTAKGYGAEKRLVPDVTAANRARNRRVALVIVEQDPATPGAAAPKKPAL